ncbi:FecR domain-containing protein [Enterovirga sp.]|mgnify:CR=1 FL=1|uniref:FecR domain-containing protein n=1 Tax=Enterovirga sp. TaxID=2026350 RepID=UPI002C4FB36F|nr:FecR domain-containing protein [Enterovirga sp.]HMO29406.1 FecR domain-containing protein [Enterovirga sp.]
MAASRSLPVLAALAAGALIAASPAAPPPGCRLEDASTSLLRIYECQERLRIAAETETRLSAIQRDGRLVGLRVDGGAVLVEASAREGFQVVTAEAVTELRGAQVAVESGEKGTAVFVREGDASVSREGRSVTLRAGQGVDVAARSPAPPPSPARSLPPAGAAPMPQARPPAPFPGQDLTVVTWGPARVSRLMARLGRS